MTSADTKHCAKCDDTKITSEFNKNKARHDGLDTWCRPCTRAYHKARYDADPQKKLSATRAYKERNPEKVRARASSYYLKNRDVISARQRAVRRANRKKVIDAYGGKCACCGEAETAFLTIDHVNDDGAQHRRELPQLKLYVWLIAQGFPEGFQILCANCNMAKGIEGMCPHQGVLPDFVPKRAPRKYA